MYFGQPVDDDLKSLLDIMVPYFPFLILFFQLEEIEEFWVDDDLENQVESLFILFRF